MDGNKNPEILDPFGPTIALLQNSTAEYKEQWLLNWGKRDAVFDNWCLYVIE